MQGDLPNIEPWLQELWRLLSEAEARLDKADYRPALASLVASLAVHRRVMTACEERLAACDRVEPEEEGGPTGMYL